MGRGPAGWRSAAALEGLSFVSYILMFGPIFCTGLSRRMELGGRRRELAMGSLVPASGAGGLALGAWMLHRGGMDGQRFARRSVAFFLIKSGVNFLAVALIGPALAVGLLGPDLSLWLTALPAALATLAIGGGARVCRASAPAALPARTPRGEPRRQPHADGGDRRHHRGIPDPALRKHPGIAGSLGYWAFDNAVSGRPSAPSASPPRSPSC